MENNVELNKFLNNLTDFNISLKQKKSLYNAIKEISSNNSNTPDYYDMIKDVILLNMDIVVGDNNITIYFQDAYFDIKYINNGEYINLNQTFNNNIEDINTPYIRIFDNLNIDNIENKQLIYNYNFKCNSDTPTRSYSAPISITNVYCRKNEPNDNVKFTDINNNYVGYIYEESYKDTLYNFSYNIEDTTYMEIFILMSKGLYIFNPNHIIAQPE